MLWRCSLFGALAAGFVYPLLQRMPPPYDGVTALALEPERLALLPGGASGPRYPPELAGPFASNERLKAAKRLFKGEILGSESVAVTPKGELVMLDRYGYVYVAAPTGKGEHDYALKSERRLYIGPGRPLGFHVVEAGSALLVCDSLKGLLRLDLATGGLRVLANRATDTGEPVNYANDLDVAGNGTVYFTSSTAGSVALNAAGFYDTMRSYLLSSLRGDATGRLLAFDPATSAVRTLVRDVAYANGVAVSADGSFVLVVETHTCRVLRHWLAGPKAGATDVFVDGLPGFPDGISRSSDGGFWLSLVVPLNPLPGLLAPWRVVRQLLSHVMMALFPYVAKSWGCVVKLAADGRPLETLMDPDGAHVATISAVTEHNGSLFLGNLGGDFVSVLAL